MQHITKNIKILDGQKDFSFQRPFYANIIFVLYSKMLK